MIKRKKKEYVIQSDGSKIDVNNTPLLAVKNCRAGNFMYKGFEIPQNAKLFFDKKGEECYLCGTQIKDGIWLVTVCYFTREKNRYYTDLYDVIAPYFETV